MTDHKHITPMKTIMERLAEKGYLHRATRQRAYVYTPTQRREDFVRQVSDAVLSGLFQDFGVTIAAYLLEETANGVGRRPEERPCYRLRRLKPLPGRPPCLPLV